MTHKKMDEIMNLIIKQVNKMRNEGQKEYSHNKDDVFANFNRVSNLIESDRKKVLMVYMLKHIDGIASYIKGHKSQRENIRGRITDTIVYLMLLWGMIEEEENGTVPRKKSNPSMHNVWKRVKNKSKRLLNGRGRLLADGLQSKSNMQKVRKKRGRKRFGTLGANS